MKTNIREISEEELHVIAKEKKVVSYKDDYGNKKEYKKSTKAALQAQKELERRRLEEDGFHGYICNRGETRNGRNKWFLSDQ